MNKSKIKEMKSSQKLTEEERSCLARRVLQVGLFWDYPGWFNSIEVGQGEVSQELGMNAWKILARDNELRQRYVPISEKIQDKLQEREIFVATAHHVMSENVEEQKKKEILVDAISYNLVMQDYDMLKKQEEDKPLIQILNEIDKNIMSEKTPLIRDEMLQTINENKIDISSIERVFVKVPDYDKCETQDDFQDICEKDKLLLMSKGGVRRMTDNFIYGRIPKKFDIYNVRFFRY
jgi:hypothetical protein